MRQITICRGCPHLDHIYPSINICKNESMVKRRVKDGMFSMQAWGGETLIQFVILGVGRNQETPEECPLLNSTDH